jgi:hypothetical protein
MQDPPFVQSPLQLRSSISTQLPSDSQHDPVAHSLMLSQSFVLSHIPLHSDFLTLLLHPPNSGSQHAPRGSQEGHVSPPPPPPEVNLLISGDSALDNIRLLLQAAPGEKLPPAPEAMNCARVPSKQQFPLY